MKMNNETVLKPSRIRFLKLLMISIPIVVGGILFACYSETSSDAVWGWALAGFFVLCTLVFVAQLVPGASFLKVGPEGIECRNFWRSVVFRWEDLQGFGVAKVKTGVFFPPQLMTGINFVPGYKPKGRQLRGMAKAIMGYDGVLPDNYGMKPEDLVEFLYENKRKYRGG